jgi:redox-sensitive bicupin YhaK (pirin superfamily)
VASPDGHDGSVTVNQDVRLYATLLGEGETTRHEVAPGRHVWIHVARGGVTVNGERLEAGDAAAISEVGPLEISGHGEAEVLVFDLA